MTTQRRPGGRSARVRSQVHEAAVALLAEPRWSQLNLGGIAERAGVQPSTLYRRWGTLSALLSDVLDARLSERSPLPDTGSLSGDLHRWALSIAADLGGEPGPVLLRALLLRSGEHDDTSTAADVLPGRTGEIDALLARAISRGEAAPTTRDVFEMVISPLYGYALFGHASLTRAPALVERLLATAADRS